MSFGNTLYEQYSENFEKQNTENSDISSTEIDETVSSVQKIVTATQNNYKYTKGFHSFIEDIAKIDWYETETNFLHALHEIHTKICTMSGRGKLHKQDADITFVLKNKNGKIEKTTINIFDSSEYLLDNLLDFLDENFNSGNTDRQIIHNNINYYDFQQEVEIQQKQCIESIYKSYFQGIPKLRLEDIINFCSNSIENTLPQNILKNEYYQDPYCDLNRNFHNSFKTRSEKHQGIRLLLHHIFYKKNIDFKPGKIKILNIQNPQRIIIYIRKEKRYIELKNFGIDNLDDISNYFSDLGVPDKTPVLIEIK